MDRRELIKSIAATVGATVAMPEGAFAKLGSPVAASDLDFFSSAQRSQVAMIAEAIIPETDTPGAIQAGVPAWIEVIVKDCYQRREQKIILHGLADLISGCQKQFAKPFPQLSEDEQVAYLTEYDRESWQKERKARKDGRPPQKTFLGLFKELTKYCYACSEVGATQAFDYRPVPGKWIASMPLEPDQKVWAL